MSILSEQSDGLGFFYGFAKDDWRQINVRHEVVSPERPPETVKYWRAYVGGSPLGWYQDKDAAERAALEWIKEHPEDLPPE